MAVCLLAFLPGCKSCLEGPEQNLPYGPVTPVRGIQRSRDLPLGPTAGLALLIRPGSAQSAHRTTWYQYVSYWSNPSLVSKLWADLRSAPEGSVSTCAPDWRLDILTGSVSHTFLVSFACGTIRTEARFSQLTKKLRRELEPLVRRTRSKPTHKLVFLSVPMTLDPQKVRKALAKKVVRILPEDPWFTKPYVQIAVELASPMPQDLTRLDQVVRNMRAKARKLLRNVARALSQSRAEVWGFDGPYPVAEDFAHGLHLKWGLTIFFQPGIDELTMRYLCSGLGMTVDKVVARDSYRLDVLMPTLTRRGDVSKLIAGLALQPKPGLWRPER